ncbi:S-adenosyl-L-methionine-dependent methyltransferase [Aspergillus floccosus]
MPRLSSSTIIRAYQRNSLLPLLLPQCRTTESAQNELRWLQERVRRMRRETENNKSAVHHVHWNRVLRSMCRARAKGLPLQYILGDQPFGDLEILCRKGVLIPRPETETFTLHAAKLALDLYKSHIGADSADSARNPRCLRILDLCSGTGCMSLLLHSVLAQCVEQMSIVGIDLSPTAVKLATDNLAHNLHLGLLSSRAKSDVHFRQGDVLGNRNGGPPGIADILRQIPEYTSDTGPQCDVLVSNPPYISPQSFWDGTTARSVRIFEPRLALVPPSLPSSSDRESAGQEDLFYHEIVGLFFKFRAGLAVLECGSRLQAERVVSIHDDIAGRLQQGSRFKPQILYGWGMDTGTDVSCDVGPCAVILQQSTVL